MIDPDTPKGPKHDERDELKLWQAYVLAALYSVAYFWLPFGMFIYWWIAVR